MQEIENEILPKDDLMFKAIYGSSGSENILKSFISSVLKIKIKNIHYTTKEIINRPNKGKHNCLDVLVELDNGEKVNVEMQSEVNSKFDNRMLAYWSELYVNSFKAGEKYENLKKVYAIWIIDDNFFKGKIDFEENYHTKWKITEQKTGISNGYFENLEMHVLELPKMREYVKIKEREGEKLTLLEKWLIFIDYTNKELVDMAVRTEKELREAMAKYHELLQDDYMIRLYQHERRMKADAYTREQDMKKRANEEGRAAGLKAGRAEGLKEGREVGRAAGLKEGREAGRVEGLKEGREEGRKEEKKEIAKKMKDQNVPIDVIISTTGLTKKEIEKL